MKEGVFLAEISGTDISEGKLPLHPEAMGRMAVEVGSMQVLPTTAASLFSPWCFMHQGTSKIFV